jgi:hypothetical protein
MLKDILEKYKAAIKPPKIYGGRVENFTILRTKEYYGEEGGEEYEEYVTYEESTYELDEEKVEKFIVQAITEALAEVKLKIEYESRDNDIIKGAGEWENYKRGSWMGFNTCIDVLEENIKQYLEGEE